jgi:hypothetical protein
MANPFKPGDRVHIKVKGTDVVAEVRLVWIDEVQVRTDAKTLLWRTVKTVWPFGAVPQAPPDASAEGKGAAAVVEAAAGDEPPTPASPVDGAGGEQGSSDPVASTQVPPSDPATSTAALPQPEPPQAGSNITSCGAGDAPVVKRKSRRRK